MSREDQWREWMTALRENAIQSRAAGRTIYLIRVEVQRQVAGWTNSSGPTSDPSDVSGTIQTIEDAGWTLFDTGYVFVPTREQGHMLTSSANISGSIIGIFTFRRTPDAPAPPPPT